MSRPQFRLLIVFLSFIFLWTGTAVAQELAQIIRTPEQVSQDPDKIGGENLSYVFNPAGKTITITGGIVPYLPKKGTTITDNGYWIGVAIDFPAGFDPGTGIKKIMQDGISIEPSLSEAEVGKGQVWCYFKLSSASENHSLYIDWSDNYVPEDFFINVRAALEVPQWKEITPQGEDRWFDEFNLYPQRIGELNDSLRYFLKVEFEDKWGKLQPSSDFLNKIRSSSIYAKGSSPASLLDLEMLNQVELMQDPPSFINKYLFVKGEGQSSLYLPIKLLRSTTEYEVNLVEGIVEFPGGKGNPAISWSFATMSSPAVSDISLAAVGEDYDQSEPIIIKGNNFYPYGKITVKFNQIPAYDVKVYTDPGDKKPYLKVWLPRGSDRLGPGVYNLSVANSDNHKQVLLGQFSVVESALLPAPGDLERVKQSGRFYEVVETVPVSEDTLVLKSRYRESLIDLSLDELMGKDTLVRKIKFADNWRSSIQQLHTSSKWADITIYDLRPDGWYGDWTEVEIRLGRVEPAGKNALWTSLADHRVRSEYIEIGGTNYGFSQAQVRMPFFHSDGHNLQVLRYDIATRIWYQQPSRVDILNQQVEFTSLHPGIFVLTER